MHLAGIQSESGPDPRIKAFRGDDLETRASSAGAIFEGGRENHEEKINLSSELRALRGEISSFLRGVFFSAPGLDA